VLSRLQGTYFEEGTVDEGAGKESPHLTERRGFTPGVWVSQVDPTERRVLGIPLSWYRRSEPVDFSGVRHPIAFVKWRLLIRRLGPHAPDFAEYRGR
jgi:hypothetical protein